MKNLNYYISLAEKGNAEAAYEAAKIMHYIKYNDVIFQAMLRKAGGLGNVNAQRWLGFICLANKLIDPESTVSNIKYVSGHEAAYAWFEKAAAQGDTVSAFAVSKCLQYGIGVEKDSKKAEDVLNAISGDFDFDMFPIMFFFDTYKEFNKKGKSESPYSNDIIQNLLAG